MTSTPFVAQSPPRIEPYEVRLSRDPRWALSEGSRHFDERSAVFDALRAIARRLDELGIPYAVVGGMALFRHGLRRFTEDVDILVTKADLKTVHEKLEGLGYLPPHRMSRHLRDTRHGVRIEFLTTGGYPGDGKPKPVAFPDPGAVSFESDGIRYVNLETLVELKLASGMTSPGRLRDLSDVLDLTRQLGLGEDFADRLNPYVREKFLELWRESRTRYVALWESGRDSPATLEAMRRAGVQVEQTANADEVLLTTTDAEIARRFDLVDEQEFWADRGE
ncbi:MAG: nucleotidyltransferase family protein [Planctomycetaceae bacterium]